MNSERGPYAVPMRSLCGPCAVHPRSLRGPYAVLTAVLMRSLLRSLCGPYAVPRFQCAHLRS
eukprot:1100758-Alexandrium_andersonii.AAC.1